MWKQNRDKGRVWEGDVRRRKGWEEDVKKRKGRFPVKYGKDLDLELDDSRKLNLLNALPLVSPYSEI